MKRKLGSVRAYRARFRLAAWPPGSAADHAGSTNHQVRSLVAVQQPDKLRIDFERAGVRSHAVCDGTWIWWGVESFPATKLNQKRLTRPGKPYSCLASVPGTGLDAGEDLIGTLLEPLDAYAFEPGVRRAAIDGVHVRVVHGRLDLDLLEKGLSSSPDGFCNIPDEAEELREVTVELITEDIRLQSQIELAISADDLPRRRRTFDASAKVTSELSIDAWELEPQLGPDAFRFEQSLAPSVTDLTEQFAQAQNECRPDPENKLLKEVMRRLRSR